MCVDGEVPGSAVLVFNIELVGVEEGLPEGYMFIWNNEVSANLFSEMDKNKDQQVDPTEVLTAFIHLCKCVLYIYALVCSCV